MTTKEIRPPRKLARFFFSWCMCSNLPRAHSRVNSIILPQLCDILLCNYWRMHSPRFLWLQHMLRRLALFVNLLFPSVASEMPPFFSSIYQRLNRGSTTATGRFFFPPPTRRTEDLNAGGKLDRRGKQLSLCLPRLRRLHRRRPDALLEKRQRVPEHGRQDLSVPVPHPEIPHHH